MTDEDAGFRDVVGLAHEPAPEGGRPLLATAMRDGRRVAADTLVAARERARREIAALPPKCRALTDPAIPTVRFGEQLVRLREELATSRSSTRPTAPPRA
jgi:nicotinate phosphoribosyltransferase